MVRKLLILCAWATFGLICFVTLSPLGLRPETGSAGLERFAAFALLGALFVSAYPHNFVKVVMLVAFAALGLEGLQHVTPDRHGHLADAAMKVAGGLSGCCLSGLAQIVFKRHIVLGSRGPS
jgi:hypothetical protein